MAEKLHWAYNLANEVLARFPSRGAYKLAMGISPSGRVHIGNFRDVITSDFVARALQENCFRTKLILSWDDFDRFRKVPKGIPTSFNEYIGCPLSKIPDPFGEFGSYAQRFEHEFEATLPALGISCEIKYQSQQYGEGVYDDFILAALRQRRDIAKILRNFKTQGLSEEQIEEYFPIVVYSRFTGKDKTKVLSFDGDHSIKYICLDTGKEDTVNITQERIVKLAWRVDWPMRWAAEGIVFEPGGKDHAAPEGSYNSGREIVQKIFGSTPPIFEGYEFIGLHGVSGKMSGSSGELVTPQELLEIYEPDLIRWLFARIAPNSTFDFALDSDVFRQYGEFDREVQKYLEGGLEEHRMQAIQLAKVDRNQALVGGSIPFRQAVGYGQVVDFDCEKLESILIKEGSHYSKETLHSRTKRGEAWLKHYNPEQQFSLRENPATDFYSSLSPTEKENIAKLVTVLKSGNSITELTSLLYSIPKDSMAPQEDKQRQREFFKIVYQLLFGKDTGPRLPTYLYFTDTERYFHLLNFPR